ncbi:MULTISPECIES: sulfite exporter TauE/SafE family protein [unclassified Oceanobacter]|uniref:sulfite exporter TauE/SafE family protein n=1 Tax=unclassified Oceanobacter TaxID=2620260 RepID=UPI0026E3018B|nr:MULTISPECIES: sulfite exporter TauE/SafE family protein [unclassified Oceanobacter]MDO6683230.1 sulfite exporter TauE/SafE family protein [Oceanobacter sp. 5_MG-2023]MDP2506171.1 sulfite exporter TauE/SafE family protein [Oceanobacter sp. 3_MG-2023]MDP2547288.1 sulfite exporter TauE/SafE family protein [Oceanobacter sp. 4_MG-2023]MDP2607412.1 sulfite exporter TauE/SafE family protein [Oceanobacter sp. 1_MG-2023]MDP2610680.1 sulfite exporter TauE/SafE family protein [Oceanobacter sp. 2_MG-20
MIEPLSLLTALLLGLFGSSHCLVMCGGIAAAIGTRSQQQPLLTALAFNSGRITSYAFAGLLVSLLGLWLQQLNDVLMLALRTLAAILLVLMGLYVARWASWLTRIEQVGQYLWQRLQPATRPLMTQYSISSRFRLGLLWGWLPCGLVYSTLSWVAANGDPLKGALTMFCFGLGTLPALFASGLAATSLSRLLSHSLSRIIAGLLLIGYGVWTAAAIWL